MFPKPFKIFSGLAVHHDFVQVSQVSFVPLSRTSLPARASGASHPTDRLDVSGAPPAPPPAPALPPGLLEEVRSAFSPEVDRYSSGRSNHDVSRDTGVEVDHRSGGGGCFGPSEHYWSVKEPGQEAQEIAIGTSVLSSASGCSVNSDGTFVVGRFSLSNKRSEEKRDSDLEHLREKGLYTETNSWASPDYLVDVPLKKGFFGKLPAALRRKGWFPQKVLTALPPDAGAFDVAPDKSVAIAQKDRVLRWDKKHGLQPWLQLSKPVRNLEYLSDGTLAVQTDAEVGCDVYLFRPGQEKAPHYLPYSEVYPKEYEQQLRRQVGGLSFLKDATLPELEKFLANPAWIKNGNWYRDCSSFGRAVVQWTEQGPELWTYDRGQGQAHKLGALAYPQSERFGEPPASRRFQAEATEDGKFLVARSRPSREDAPVDVAVWDLETGQASLVPGVRQVSLDAGQSQLSAQIITGEKRTFPLSGVADLKHEDWYVKARLSDLLDSDAELKPEQQIGEDREKIIVGGVHVRKRDENPPSAMEQKPPSDRL